MQKQMLNGQHSNGLTKNGNVKSTANLIQKLTALKSQMETTIKMSNFKKTQTNFNQQNQDHFITKYQVETKAQIKRESIRNKSKIETIRENIIGFNTQYISPFNIQLESVYVDHTATNRPYATVQNMVKFAKKFAANPHTEFSHFGKYSTQMVNYALDSLLSSFSASHENYVALPTGSGSTGAIQKAIKFLKIIQEKEGQTMPDIFLTPYQHHSNILPWVEYYENVTVLASDQNGNLLLPEIYNQLKSWKKKNIIVTVSAASNVTSQVTDLRGLNQIIKKLRVQNDKNIVFSVDCAAYCCHHQLNLTILDEIDFAHLSPHKNLGGSESCGILVAKKQLVKFAKPTFPGGGTVNFVKGYSKQDVMYDVDVFHRQIAGTPPFFGFYRAALSFQLLKKNIGYDFIHQRQKSNTKLFMKIISEQNQTFKKEDKKNLINIYGQQNFQKRANVITFNIITDNQIVQHSFISLILADAFGIQLRSGCFCAGPFGMQLLKLNQKKVQFLKEAVSVGILKEKPGYLRLDLTFYLQDFQIEYVAKAICLTAEYSKNMEMVYTICNDGEIKRHKLFKDTFVGMYGIQNSQIADQAVKRDIELDVIRLKNRKQTLERQYKVGKQILQHPLKFLKEQVYQKTLKVKY